MIEIMELNTEKILEIKAVMGFTYQDLADRMGFKHRQQVHDLIKQKRIWAADKFAKVFNMDPRDLIK